MDYNELRHVTCPRRGVLERITASLSLWITDYQQIKKTPKTNKEIETNPAAEVRIKQVCLPSLSRWE